MSSGVWPTHPPSPAARHRLPVTLQPQKR